MASQKVASSSSAQSSDSKLSVEKMGFEKAALLLLRSLGNWQHTRSLLARMATTSSTTTTSDPMTTKKRIAALTAVLPGVVEAVGQTRISIWSPWNEM